MIIDCILDRYEGNDYNPREFYFDMLEYGSSGIDISRAMDFGNEEDVREQLCRYVDCNKYNGKIKDFINKAKWLVVEDGRDWNKVVSIL